MSSNKMRVRQGDLVVVLAGRDRGRTGRVIRVDPRDRKVAVEGVALVKRSLKAQGEQVGGVVSKERLIDVSNVALWDAKESRRIKVAVRVDESGRRTRVDRVTGVPLDKV